MMVAAPPDVGVEAFGWDAERLQILPGWAVGQDFAPRRDVVGVEAVRIDPEHAYTRDAIARREGRRAMHEERWLDDVARGRVPGKQHTVRRVDTLPARLHQRACCGRTGENI